MVLIFALILTTFDSFFSVG